MRKKKLIAWALGANQPREIYMTVLPTEIASKLWDSCVFS